MAVAALALAVLFPVPVLALAVLLPVTGALPRRRALAGVRTAMVKRARANVHVRALSIILVKGLRINLHDVIVKRADEMRTERRVP